MKRLLSFFLGLIIISLFFCGIPFRIAKPWLESVDGHTLMSTWNKNQALLTEILLKEYGERGVCRLLYSIRDRKHRMSPTLISLVSDSTYLLKEMYVLGDSLRVQEIYSCLRDENCVNNILNALMRRQNDTIFICDEPEAAHTDLRGVFNNGAGWGTWVSILSPKNLWEKEIQDSTAWEQEALRDIKEQIRHIKQTRVKLLEPPSKIPYSEVDVYKLYFDHTL